MEMSMSDPTVLLVRGSSAGEVNRRLSRTMSLLRGEVPPLGLAYIASVLEQHHIRVSILDIPALGISEDDLLPLFEKKRPSIVGITVMTPLLRNAFVIAEKARMVSARIVLGGPHLCAFPRETLSRECVDFGIHGEADYTFLELVTRIASGSAYDDVPGLIFKDGAEIRVNPPSYVEDIDTLPFPAFHLLPIARYSSILDPGRRIATMVTSRGCPYKCGFCFKQPRDRYVRYRNPASVVEEMAWLKKEFSVEKILFYDSSIGVNKQHAEAICREMIRRDVPLPWEAPCRLDNIDAHLMSLMRAAGCERLRFGVESGNEEILRRMNKYFPLDRARDIFREAKRIGLDTFAYFIIGYAGETERTIKETIAFAKEIGPGAVMFNVATPYPETDLFRDAVARGLISPSYWSDYSLGKEVGAIPRFVKGADAWARRAYRSFYLRPRYIARFMFRAKYIKHALRILKSLIFFQQ
jgi:radical SAM superfamily enzyme YgiQ (UPF0313 family)